MCRSLGQCSLAHTLYTLIQHATHTGQQRAAKDNRAFARLTFRNPDGSTSALVFAFSQAGDRDEALDLINTLNQSRLQQQAR